MPQDMNVGRKKPAPPQTTQAELLARVTSRKLPPPPPPADGGPPQPLPEGKIVGTRSASSLTPAEREAMETLGWSENIPISPSMAGILEQVLTEKRAQIDEVTLPIDPKTPPLKVITKKLSELTPQEIDAIKAANIFDVKQREQAVAQQEQQNELFVKEMTQKGIIPAMQAVAEAEAFRAQKEAARPVSPAQETDLIDTSEVDRVRMATPKAKEEPKTKLQEQAPAQAASDTGAVLHPANCPHCDWPLHMPGTAEPEHSDKMSFLHAMLGAKCWQKDYELFGGNVHVIFRTLSARELDAIYEQAYQDRDRGEYQTDLDFWERVNRYRLFLQLQRMSADGPKGYMHDMADGLSKDTNPEATGFWWNKEKDDPELNGDKTPLKLVQEYIVENVLKTEALFRVVNTSCNQFNRLVAKMEAMAANSDFWKPTEEQS